MNTLCPAAVFRQPPESVRSGAEYVIDEPVPLVLPNRGAAKHTLRHEHVVGRLEDALEVGGVALGEGKLSGELVEGDAPGEPAVGSGDLEQPVEAARHG